MRGVVFFKKKLSAKVFFIITFLVLTTGYLSATDLDSFSPDKTGKNDSSEAISLALKKAAKTDKFLRFSPGKYLIKRPVIIPPYITITAVPGTVTLIGKDRNSSIFLFKRNHGNKIIGLNFQNAGKAIGCIGDGYFATARVIDCNFSNCKYGVYATPVQLVAFVRCNFSNCDYGLKGLRGYGGRSNGVYILQCSFSKCKEWCVEIEGSPTNIRDSDFESCEGGGIRILDAMVATVEGCYFEAVGKEKNRDIEISPLHLHTGVVSIRNNQFNSVFSENRILISKNGKVHIYDNFVYLRKNQKFVKCEEDNKNVLVENNFFEGPGRENKKNTYVSPDSKLNFTGILNVKSFGAKGDGETDDTEAIQKAMDIAAKNHKVCYIPYGTYPVSKPLVIPAVNSGFFILRSNGATIKAIKRMDYVLVTERTFWIIIDGLNVDANHLAKYAVYLYHIGGARSAVRHLDAMNALSHGILLRECQILTVENCVSFSNGGDGFRFEGCNGTVATTLTSNLSKGNGITITECKGFSGGMTLNYVDVELNKKHGIVVEKTGSPVVINGGWLEGNQRDGIHINTKNVVVKNVGITGIGDGNNWAIHLLSKARGCVIQNNYLQAGGGDSSYVSVRIDEGTTGNIVEPNFHRGAGNKLKVLTGPPAFNPDTVFVPVGNNLVKNGGFEEDNGWNRNYSKPSLNRMTDEKAHTGKFSRKIITDYDGGALQIISLKQNKRYRLTGWIYVVKGKADIAVHNGFSFNYNRCVSNSHKWVKKTFDFTALGTRGYIALKGAGSKTIAYFDDVELYEIVPVKNVKKNK